MGHLAIYWVFLARLQTAPTGHGGGEPYLQRGAQRGISRSSIKNGKRNRSGSYNNFLELCYDVH